MTLEEKINKFHIIKITDDIYQYSNHGIFGPAISTKEINSYHEDYLVKYCKEIDRNFKLKIDRPVFDNNANLNTLKIDLESMLDTIEESAYEDEDNAQYIYESCLRTFYGGKIFDWIRDKTNG